MQNVWVLASLWVGLALVATLLAIWFKISTALTEIVVGTVAQLIFGAFIVQSGLGAKSEWISFLAGTGAIVLTFLAGAELDPTIFRTKWKESTVIGLVGFIGPFLGCTAVAHYVLHWTTRSSWLAGVALSTTSVAVVYAVIGTWFQRHRLRKGHSGTLTARATLRGERGRAALPHEAPASRSVAAAPCQAAESALIVTYYPFGSRSETRDASLSARWESRRKEYNPSYVLGVRGGYVLPSAHRAASTLLSVTLLAVGSFAVDNPNDRSKKVDQLFAAFDTPRTPGCALGVIREGEFVHKRAYGAASLELSVPLTTRSAFVMGSISKQFTAASVVLAAEQGYLVLDDDVRKYIPELPDYGKTITLREMLHHTSGLRDLENLLDFSGRNQEDIHPFAELIDLITRQKELNFHPGEEYLYSNTNYVLLAEVVHRATGKPLSRFAEENIFKPLGMNQTRFYDDHSIVVPGRVAAYDPAGGGAFSVNWSTNYERVGDGGLMSSVEDLLLWDRNFYANKLGKGTLVQDILSRGVLNKGDKIGYALGLGISSYRGLPVVEHEGANFGYHTELLRFPEQQFSVICLCNLGSIDPELAATQVADIYLEGSFHDQPAGAQASDVERQALAGLYRNPENHSVAEVAVIAGGLQVRNIRMKQEGANHYTSLLGRFEARFEPMSQGGMKMLFGHSYTEPYIFERFQPIKASAEDLAQYAGDYASNELQATYRFRVKEQTLTLTINWTEFPPFFSPSLRDEFHAPDDTAIVFRRDAAGHIVGCDVYTDRVRKISLARK